MSEELAKYEDRSAAQIPYMPEKADVSILNNEAKLLPSFKKETSRIRSVFDREGLYADQPTEIIELMAGFTALQLNSNYRVFTFDNPFNETVTSYFHKSIGGYHGAKLKKYQEIIDFHLDKD